MVILRLLPLLMLLLVTPVLNGCGGQWWGEESEPARIISADSARSSKGDGSCASWQLIYQGSENESTTTLNCWADKVSDTWKRIRGANPDQLTDDEIRILIRRGVVEIDGDKEDWLKKALAIKNLLGFGPTLTRERANQWIHWTQLHRADIRLSYQSWVAPSEHSFIAYGDAARAARVAGSLLRELGWKKSLTELSTLLQEAIHFQDPGLKAGLAPAVRSGRNLLGFLCPLSISSDLLDPAEVGACLDRAQKHFELSAVWFEFMANSKDHILEAQTFSTRNSLNETRKLIEAWFTQPGLKPLVPAIWFDWAKKTGAHPPEDFVRSLNFLRRFKGKSNENAIDPTEMIRAFEVLRTVQLSMLDAIPHFVRELQASQCLNADARDWNTCTLRNSQVREKSKAIDQALRVKNPRHGQLATPLNGNQLTHIALYDAVSQQLIEAFDEDGDGLISADLKNDQDELVTLILSSIETYQAVDRYVRNLGQKLSTGKPLILSMGQDDEIDLSPFNIRGFAKLVAITNDVLVERTPERKNFLKSFLENFYNNFPRSSLVLDRDALTAILTSIDALSKYRRVALAALFDDDNLKMTDSLEHDRPFARALFNQKLPEILRRNFPRTYQLCQDFGFDISCGIAFDEVIPASKKDSSLIQPSDLDLLTILATGMEGVFDTCNPDGSATLSMQLMDGNDELDCGFTRLKDGVQRLIEAEVIKPDTETKDRADFILNSINSTVLTRWSGKVALIRGTKNEPWKNLPPFWEGKHATLGSAYGLMSDFMSPDRVEANPNKRR